MNIAFDAYHNMEPARIHLAAPGGKLLTALNGVQPDSVSLKLQLNNTYELSFTVDRYITVEGAVIESNGYQLLDEKMKLYLEGVGWFIMKTPSLSNDGASESKSVDAESVEIEWVDKNLKGFKVNCGTTDSAEMLIPGNIEDVDGVEFARRQICFCDKAAPEYSLLHIVMKTAGLTGWSIGHVDDIPKVYSSYKDGELTEKAVRLSDEIGVFDVNSSGLYSFFTQDLAKFFECIFLFDIENYTVNVYRAEHLGKDTNVTISFRNFQNSNEISCSNSEDIYTCCYVSGGDDLGIEQVNFGWNYIEDKSYFLNTRYLSPSLIAKYNEWKQYMESRRFEYIGLTRQYNRQLAVMTELTDRVPLDDCSTEWNKFSDEKLLAAKDNYTAQKAGYESFYVDENGNFDEAKLAASEDADTYYQVRDVILPSIEIEIANRSLPSSVGKQDYVETYLTDWKLYGTSELSVKLEMYQNQKAVCESGHYDLPYEAYEALSGDTDNVEAASQYPPHTRDMHEQMHAQYQEALLQLDETISGSCAEAYTVRTLEYQEAERLMEQIFEERATLVEEVTKETWHIEGIEPFTRRELDELSKLDTFTDYVNDNMFLTDSDDSITALDERLRLLDAAKADLETLCRPQYQYDTTLEHFISDYAYKELTHSLRLGDFLYLEAQEGYFVKLRLISMSYNPMSPEGSLSLGFSNMLQNASKRYDTTYLLDLRGYSGRNQISGTAGGSLRQEDGVTLLPGLLEKILASSQYTNNVEHAVNQHFQSIIGQLVAAKGLEAEMIKATDLSADNGFFQYLQSALIAADKIVADSGEFKQLSALIAAVDSLLAGKVSAELGHIISLTAQNVRIDEAVIRDLIAAQITVGMLKAGDISADSFHIAADDGGLQIAGNTMQFRDAAGTVRIQIGRDAQNQFTFCLYDESGKGVLIDSQGVKESALSDGLIKNEMLAGGITKDKLSFHTVETDENGKVNASEIVIDGQGLDMKFTTIEQTVNGLDEKLEENLPFRLELLSTGGVIFTNGRIDSHLTVTLYRGNEDVTAQYPDSCFIWTRLSGDGELDAYWNSQHLGGSKSLHITNEDLYKKAQFRCCFWLEGEIAARTI